MRRDDHDNDGLRVTGRLGMWERDLRTGEVVWSHDIDDILGLPRGGPRPSLDRMLGTIVPEEREYVEAALSRSVDHRLEHHQVEYRCRLPDGGEVWVRNEWSLHCDPEGQPAVLRGVIQDITHRVRTKAALRRRTQLLELLYAVTACANTAETVEQALWTALESVCAFGRFAVGWVYLASREEPRVLAPSRVFHADDPARYAALRAAVQDTRHGPGAGMPGRVLASGQPAWTGDLAGHGAGPATAAAIAAGLRAALDLPVMVGAETAAVMELFSLDDRGPDEELMAALGHVAAQLGRVFERQRSAEALRASEARMRQILESMPIGVYVLDAAGKPWFANRYALAMRGARGHSGRLEGVYGIYFAGTDEPYPRERHPVIRALSGESSVVADVEFRPLTEDGSQQSEKRFPLECWGSPVFDERGRVTYAVSAFYDISERKKVERMKEEFVSVVSHELRTPLTAIQGAIGLLENGVLGPLPDEALEVARIAGDGCRRLHRLVSELLDVQKLESGAPVLHPRPIPLGPLLEQEVAASRPYATSLGVALELEDGAPGAVVVADDDRLAQVVANLLSNALKHSPRGERVKVTVQRVAQGVAHGVARAGDGEPHGEVVRVAVEDRGPGVPEEFRPSLFQKFSQADASDARPKGGTGLGLAICKMIVEKLGGRIAHEPACGSPAGGTPLGVADRLPAGAADRLPAGVADRLPAGVADRLPAGAADRLPAGVADRLPAGAADRLPAGVADRLGSASAGAADRLGSASAGARFYFELPELPRRS